MSNVEIAKQLGITRQRVHQIIKALNDDKTLLTPREQVVDRHFPWKLEDPFAQASPARLMRNHGEYMATGGKGMSEDALKALRGFYRRLRDNNVVVEFDPRIPPIPRVSYVGGFNYVPRTDEDGDLIIRVNEYTNLTDEGKRLWRFPTREP